MTDSEDDVLSSHVYNLPNDRTTIYANGPNISSVNNRYNFLTSAMHPSRNNERRNLNNDQRNIYCIRDTSPVCLRNVQDFRPRNFQYPYNTKDTNVSMSATDIALAIKNEAYNNHDLSLIQAALNKQFKMKLRRRVEKRRNQRLLLRMRMSKRKSDDDSDAWGSDSSIQSDSSMSIKTAPCMTNNSRYKTKFNLLNIKMTANEGNIYNDCTKNIRMKAFKNIFNPKVLPAPIQKSIKPRKGFNCYRENRLSIMNKFKNGFLLPSQRFKQSENEHLSSNLSRLNHYNVHSNQIINAEQKLNNNEISENNLKEDIESQQEEIFSETTIIERNSQIVNNSHKRIIDKDDLHCNLQKKRKVTSAQIHKSLNEVNCIQKDLKSDFIFVKPQTPVINSCITKKKLHSPEKFISKSRQPLFDTVELPNFILSSVKEVLVQKSPKVANDIEIIEKEKSYKECDKPACLSDDLSMQPSFSKRKLFTQKLDIAEKKNISNSSLSSSPHIKNINSNKEKSKARKFASSQSCLSRDVLEEDNNVHDLIHKIVPVGQMNITNVTNTNCQQDSNDKWDITSAISTCDEKYISNTYTEEEIFKVDDHSNNESKLPTNTKGQSKLISNCKIILERLPAIQESKIANKQTTVKIVKETNKEDTNAIIKSFWDTDTESEQENYESSDNLNDSQINNKSINQATYRKKLRNSYILVEDTKAIRTRNKSPGGKNIKNATGAGINKSTKSDKRENFVELMENNNNLLNINFFPNGKSQETNKPTESSKKFKLISHRMRRSQNEVKSKEINTIETTSPKDSDIPIKEKEKPKIPSEVTEIINHRTGKSKSKVKSRTINKTSNSNLGLNISFKSLRSYYKNL